METVFQRQYGYTVGIFRIRCQETQHGSEYIAMGCGTSVKEVECAESGYGEGDYAEGEVSQHEVRAPECGDGLVQRASAEEENVSLSVLEWRYLAIDWSQDSLRVECIPT
jgi:hypothetical protein